MLLASTLACEAHDAGPGGSGSDACSVLSGRTLRWIVPFSPGGGYDVYSRLLEPFYEEELDAQIAVENRSGAGGRLGARAIRDAEPDGRTMGIVNAYSLLVAEIAEGVTGLHPVDDFTVLGRIAAGDPILVAARGSGLVSIEDVLDYRGDGPLLFGLNGVGGTGFVAASVTAELLGIDAAYLVGYPGTRELSLGLMRGEFDLGAFTFESIIDQVESGELIPLLRMASLRDLDYASIEGVPVLAGSEGLAARMARARGEDPEASIAVATALSSLFEIGRLVVAPPGLAPDMAECLSDRLAAVASRPDFREAARVARRDLAFTEPAEVAAGLEATEGGRSSLAEILRRHAALAHGGRVVP